MPRGKGRSGNMEAVEERGEGYLAEHLGFEFRVLASGRRDKTSGLRIGIPLARCGQGASKRSVGF